MIIVGSNPDSKCIVIGTVAMNILSGASASSPLEPAEISQLVTTAAGALGDDVKYLFSSLRTGVTGFGGGAGTALDLKPILARAIKEAVRDWLGIQDNWDKVVTGNEQELYEGFRTWSCS